MLKVGDIMTTPVDSISPSIPIIEAAHQMKIRGTGAIPVCETGTFWGVITERDIVTGIVANARDPVTEPVSSLISKQRQPTISPGADVRDAIKLMMNKGIRVLAVTQNGNLVGLLPLENLAWESLAIAASFFIRNTKTSDTSRHERRLSKHG